LAVGLAGEAPGEDVVFGEVIRINLSDVAPSALDVRKAGLQHGPGVWVDLDLPDALHAGAIEAKIEATGPGEQGDITELHGVLWARAPPIIGAAPGSA
jgi:hypothetical protein